jgi:hypothetical protein
LICRLDFVDLAKEFFTLISEISFLQTEAFSPFNHGDAMVVVNVAALQERRNAGRKIKDE